MDYHKKIRRKLALWSAGRRPPKPRKPRVVFRVNSNAQAYQLLRRHIKITDKLVFAAVRAGAISTIAAHYEELSTFTRMLRPGVAVAVNYPSSSHGYRRIRVLYSELPDLKKGEVRRG